MMGCLQIINYIKCGNGIEMIGIYSDKDHRLQWYAVDNNEMVQNVQSAMWKLINIYSLLYVVLVFFY